MESYTIFFGQVFEGNGCFDKILLPETNGNESAYYSCYYRGHRNTKFKKEDKEHIKCSCLPFLICSSFKKINSDH